jgi:hypothetical protein
VLVFCDVSTAEAVAALAPDGWQVHRPPVDARGVQVSRGAEYAA